MTEPPTTDRVWPWVRYFLEHHLPVHRGARANTLASYRTAFRQFRQFLFARMGQRAARDLSLEALEPSLVLDFLGWLQSEEGGRVGGSTRNVRLAALRSFFRCLELHCRADERPRWERFRRLPEKRTPRAPTYHLEVHEIDQVFAQVDPTSAEGLRDFALLALLYNTGARASEIAGLRRCDLFFEDFPSVRLLGKGGRERSCPLWPSTALVLKRYLDGAPAPLSGSNSPVFRNQRGGALTRHGIARRVTHYLKRAGQSNRRIQSKRLSTHSFRHSTAIHLLESGADMHVIKAWLGHRSTRSTDHYLDLNLQNQRDLLTRFSPPSRLERWTESPANTDDWLDTL